MAALPVSLEEFIGRLDRVKPDTFKGRAGYVSRCPSCAAQGRDSSGVHLSVYVNDNRYIQPSCRGNCSKEDILSVLGLQNSDLRVDEPGTLNDKTGASKKNPVYVYTDEDGKYAFEKERIDPKKPGQKKAFPQYVRFDADGKPVSKIEKISKGTGRTYMAFPTPDEFGLNGRADVLYKLPKVRAAIARGETIYLGEGEKASDLWEDKKLPVHSCQRAGAGPGKWLPALTNQLKGAKMVVIIADRDPRLRVNDEGIGVEIKYNGEDYAKEVFLALRAERIPCQVVRSRTKGEHDDGYDHVAAGFAVSDLEIAYDLMPSKEIAGMAPETGEDFQMMERRYLWPPYLWYGQCCMFSGDSGVSKSTLTIAMMAGFSVGQLPNGGGECEPQKALYFIGDADSWQEYETLYRAHGGVPNAVRWVRGIRSLRELCDNVRDHRLSVPGCNVVVVDPFVNFMQASGYDNTSDSIQMAAAAGYLSDLARDEGLIVWMVHHDNRTGEFLGSAMLKARVRGYLQAKFHPTETGLVIVEDRKGSLLSERGEPFAYRRIRTTTYGEIEYVRNWPPVEGMPGSAEVVSKLEAAKKFLLDIQPWTKVDEVEKEAKRFGISFASIKRAKTELKASGEIEYTRFGDPDGPYFVRRRGGDPFGDD